MVHFWHDEKKDQVTSMLLTTIQNNPEKFYEIMYETFQLSTITRFVKKLNNGQVFIDVSAFAAGDEVQVIGGMLI